MELVYTERQEWARTLYVQLEKTPKETADTVATDEATLQQWIDEGNWDAVRRSKLVQKETQLRYLYQALGKIKDAMAEEGPSLKQIDLYNKYLASIRGLEDDRSVSHIIEVLELLLNWLVQRDLPLAKKMAVQCDLFVKERIGPEA